MSEKTTYPTLRAKRYDGKRKSTPNTVVLREETGENTWECGYTSESWGSPVIGGGWRKKPKGRDPGELYFTVEGRVILYGAPRTLIDLFSYWLLPTHSIARLTRVSEKPAVFAGSACELCGRR